MREAAFKRCQSLKEIRIPNSVWFIKREAFQHCHKLERVYLPESLQKIDTFAFAGCTSLTNINACSDNLEVNMPYNVDYLDFYAFEDCPIKDLAREQTRQNELNRIAENSYNHLHK